MNNIEKYIKNKSFEIENVFANINKNGFKKTLEYSIEVNKLDVKYSDTIDITKANDFLEMFESLKEYANYPALYYFSINPKIDYNEIISLIGNVKTELNKSVPAINKYKENLGILYVGKVKKIAWGRLIQHLGYHKHKKSHGLQIEYWARKTSLNLGLTFKVMFFEKNVDNYIQILEKALAEKIKPIIGKH